MQSACRNAKFKAPKNQNMSQSCVHANGGNDKGGHCKRLRNMCFFSAFLHILALFCAFLCVFFMDCRKARTNVIAPPACVSEVRG